MLPCKACGTSRFNADGTPCVPCYGRGYVKAYGHPCERCGGNGTNPSFPNQKCAPCKGAGVQGDPIPLDHPPLRIPAKALRKAFDDILNDRFADADDASFIHGVAGGLLASGYELTQDTAWLEDWINAVTTRGDVIIDVDGVYSEFRGQGVRLYPFVYEGVG